MTGCRTCVTLGRVTSFATVRVAAVQAAPVMLDLDASLDKAVALTRDAAAQGAQLIVLPECFLSFYPSSALTESRYDEAQIDLFERMWHSAVDVPGPQIDRLAAVCAEGYMNDHGGIALASPAGCMHGSPRVRSILGLAVLTPSSPDPCIDRERLVPRRR